MLQRLVCKPASGFSKDDFPGSEATSDEIRRLADEYREAADWLLTVGRRKNPISSAPGRLCAIHAIELYLNAVLHYMAHDASVIRGFQHDLGSRADLCAFLDLRRGTKTHLLKLSQTREYLVARYCPKGLKGASQINRLMATMTEVGDKVTLKIATKRLAK